MAEGREETTMGALDGKVACITGGTRSIGRGMAEAFVAAGASVVVNGRDEAKGRQAIEEMSAGDTDRQARLAFFGGDASKQSTVEGLIDFTVEHFGQLDVCCLNSGGVKNTAPIAQMSDEEWSLEIDWNLNHVFWGMRRALNHMIPRECGRIIVTSSVEGKLGKPGIGGYATTKHAVNGLVKSAALEVGTLGVTVNAVLPGIIETDIVRATGPESAVAMGLGGYDEMIQLFCAESAIKRPNTVEEVAAVAVLLASDAARNITGCLFPVDGGTMPY
jgi:3-hydroxybutyrate dehydrogenase